MEITINKFANTLKPTLGDDVALPRLIFTDRGPGFSKCSTAYVVQTYDLFASCFAFNYPDFSSLCSRCVFACLAMSSFPLRIVFACPLFCLVKTHRKVLPLRCQAPTPVGSANPGEQKS